MFIQLQKFIIKHKYLVCVIAIALCFTGISRGPQLPIKLSLSDLLPEDRVSVREMENVAKEVGGVGYLVVLFGPYPNVSQYLPKVEKSIKGYVEVKYSFFEREQYQLKDKSLYLLPRKKFKKMLKHTRVLFNQGQSGLLNLGLEDEEDRKYNKDRAKEFFNSLGEDTKHSQFFETEDKRYATFLIKPNFNSEDIGRSEQLIETVSLLISQNVPKDVPYEFVGRYKDKANDSAQIKTDIAKTGIISLLTIAVLLILGLGAFRAAFVTIVGVNISLGWTIGLAHYFVGQINILTGFLLAILGGLGVEYGIHLIRRYYQERAMGHDHQTALELTYFTIGRALFSAAITSACAFLILSFSDFRGFSELGIIAGLGILSIYASYMLCFPVMSDFLRTKPRFGKGIEIFGYYPFNVRWAWIIIPFSIISIWGISQAEFEYNFKRMHQLSTKTIETTKFVEKLFGKDFSPAALLANSPQQANEVRDWLDDQEIIKNSISLYDIVPEDMDYRYRSIQKLSKRVLQASDQEIESKTGISAADIRKWLKQKPYTASSLPLHIRDSFGKSGNIIIAYPDEDLDKADALIRFANLMKEAKANFPGLQIGSDTMIFSEILDHIINDGRIVLLLFFLGAFFIFWLDFKSFKDALLLELQLFLGMLVLVGLMGAFGERFSILNVTMIPAVLAAGVDMGVHVQHRRREGYRAISSAKFVAQAVQLSALTSVIGFGALFFAQAKMLQGIAVIAVLGQLSMYMICMVLSPLSFAYLRQRLGVYKRHQKGRFSL